MFYLFTTSGWEKQDISDEKTDSLKGQKDFKIVISNIMNKKIKSIEDHQRLYIAYEKMKEENVKHLFVTKEGQFLGILSDRDLKLYQNTNNFKAYAISDIISPITLGIDEKVTLGVCAQKFLTEGVNALPVISKEREVCGIITTTDILKFCAKNFS